MFVNVAKEITQVTLQDKNGTFFTIVREGDIIELKTKTKNLSGQIKVLQEDGLIIQDKAAPYFILYRDIEGCSYSKSSIPNFSRFFDKIIEKLIRSGKIRKQETLDAFLHGYIKGVCAQQKYNWPSLDSQVVQSLKKDYEMRLCKPFYFVMENDEYLIVMAEEIGEAIELFKRRKKNIKCKSVVNESIWKRQYHSCKEPYEVISN